MGALYSDIWNEVGDLSSFCTVYAKQQLMPRHSRSQMFLSELFEFRCLPKEE